MRLFDIPAEPRRDGRMAAICANRIVATGPDFYPTPAWATHALCEHETFEGAIWEPCCGDGAMSRVLKARGYSVVSTDLHDRGYGLPDMDFLKADVEDVPNIVTNPPFGIAEAVIDKALSLISGHVDRAAGRRATAAAGTAGTAARRAGRGPREAGGNGPVRNYVAPI
jgi:hypothetical protein